MKISAHFLRFLVSFHLSSRTHYHCSWSFLTVVMLLSKCWPFCTNRKKAHFQEQSKKDNSAALCSTDLDLGLWRDFTVSLYLPTCLQVKERTVLEALTQKKTTAGDETFTINYKMEDVSTFCLFFWLSWLCSANEVPQVMEESSNSLWHLDEFWLSFFDCKKYILVKLQGQKKVK